MIQRRDDRREQRSLRELVVWKAAMDGKGAMCAHCGNVFISVRSTRKHCSNSCRQAAYRQRVESRVEASVAEICERFEHDIERITKRGRAEYRAERVPKLVRAAARGDADAIAELNKLK
jgi:hypothetical protein